MKGSVTKYSITNSSRPRWRYRIDAGKDEQGHRLQPGKGGFRKEAEAEEAMRKHMDEIVLARETAAGQRHNLPVKAPPTLAEWLRTYLDTYGVERCQPKTLERYRELANYIINAVDGLPYELGQLPLSVVTHLQLEPAFYALLSAKAKRREHLGASTVRKIAGVVNVALNKAFRLDMIPINPMLKVELPKVEPKEALSLTSEEISALRDSCRVDWTFAFIEIALATGARRGELLALSWPDLDWATATLTISKSLEQTKAGLRIKRPKNGKSRLCKMPQSAIAALQFLRSQQQEHRRLFLGDYKNQDLIFCEADGNHLQPDLVSQVIVRRMRKAGIKKGSLHTLRHSHASHLLSNKVPLPAVSKRLGHANPNITARIYSHALPPDDQLAADVWDSVIDLPVQ
jgi:integrase